MDNGVCRDEYQRGMDRLHCRIDNIASDVAEIKTASKFIKESADKIHEAVFGNGKPGALHWITKILTQVKIQWCFLIMLIGMIGTMVYVFVGHLSR